MNNQKRFSDRPDRAAGDDAALQLFQQLKAEAEADPYPQRAQREQWLRALEQALKARRHALTDALNSDFGQRSAQETELAELLPSVQMIRYCRKNLKRWMKAQKRKTGLLFQPARCRVEYQPLGVVGVMVPWNYPVFLALGPVINALAAGNRVLLKLSEYTPATNKVIRQLLTEAFAGQTVAVSEGGADFSARFARLPFDHLVFTGSTAVGRQVMQGAARQLTPVTLELGGKSPVVITEQFPLPAAAERILFGKSLNAGQTCVAPDYLFCHHSQLDELIRLFKQQYQRMYPQFSGDDSVTSVLNRQQFERLQQWLDQARDRGCQIVPLYEGLIADQEARRIMPLHLLIEPDTDLPVMQQEIFGPLLPVYTYQDEAEVIAFINQRPRPLALYLFSYDRAQQQRFLQQTHSGGVCLNDTLLQVAQEDLPFGGIGDSGMGHYHGKEGFIRLSHARAVFSKGRINSSRLIYPPYRTALLKLLRRFWG